MGKRELKIGDIVQINPSHENFGGQLLVVTEPKEWGCQGRLYLDTLIDVCRCDGRAYLRVKWENMEYVGTIEWIYESNQEHENE
jgi:hypothetical protein